MTSLRRHLTYANVVATLALVLAVAGGSTAIAISSKTKINGKLIKPGTITTKQLKDGSITGPKLARIDRITVSALGGTGTTQALCPQGSRLISGGVFANSSTQPVRGSVPSSTSSTEEVWAGTSDGPLIVTAMCLRATPGK